ncbi:MAG TPA: T9SS type A sorting domain-containing protein [Dehalococcoidia bacterium]|nr:T9SS type A sorting domain-containing protein [Dehalococcoidia bacterium]
MKRATAFICWFLLVVFSLSEAFAWGSATHAYLAKELGRKQGIVNLQEVYGSMLPDMFNLMYGSEYKDYLWHQTHYEFMKVADKARGCQLKAFVFGGYSHSDAWGADYTAHYDGRTTPGEGDVIAKAATLEPELIPRVKGILVGSGVPDAEAQLLAEELAPGLAENFVETAVDLLIKRNEDPAIGLMILLSAQLRNFRIPFLLAQAYGADFANAFDDLTIVEASDIIIVTEREFRELMKLYGGIFLKEESEAIQLLAAQGATLAEAYLKAGTGYAVTIPPEVIAEILRDYAIPCVEGDYANEVSATLAYVEEELANRGIETCCFPLWWPKHGQHEIASVAEPAEFSLGQNRPNPFNPTTTIDYSLPQESHVKIAVYNTLGQQVDVLVDAVQPTGHHSLGWDASGLASGVYFYRIETEGYTESKRMFLLK